jgi:type IV pilus assembly protein PilW
VRTRRYTLSAGFSLAEIMVGLTIGLVTVLVVAQVMQVAEARRRGGTSGADAMVNAALSLYTLEREGKNAGFGLTSIRTSIGCNVKAKYGASAVREFPLTSVEITDGADGAPDSLRFFASQKNGIVLPIRVAADHAQDDTIFSVVSDLGVNEGDLMIAVPEAIGGTNWCSLFQVAGAAGTSQVSHAIAANSWNQDDAGNIFPVAGYAAGDYLINLGEFSDRTYSIADNRILRLTEFDAINNASVEQEVFSNVVQMQAAYGKDTNNDGIVDAWNATDPADAAEWQQIRAIRIAVVARGRQPETDVVTLDGSVAASSCDSATPHPAAVCWRPDPNGNGVKIDVSGSGENWQRYRYRVAESTVALRNVIWQQ